MPLLFWLSIFQPVINVHRRFVRPSPWKEHFNQASWSASVFTASVPVWLLRTAVRLFPVVVPKAAHVCLRNLMFASWRLWRFRSHTDCCGLRTTAKSSMMCSWKFRTRIFWSWRHQTILVMPGSDWYFPKRISNWRSSATGSSARSERLSEFRRICPASTSLFLADRDWLSWITRQ